MASTPSPLGVLSTVNGYPKREHSRPSGRACCFVFGYRLGTVVPPWGPPPHPGPAVHSDGWTALHWAAAYGNRRMIRSLVDADADVHAQDRYGCAVCARGESAVECAGRVPAAVGRAGRRRCTWPRPMAIPRASRSCCSAAPTGPSRTTSTGNAALRRTAETENRNSRARAGGRRSKSRNDVGSSRSTKRGRGRCTPPAASQPPHPSCLAPHPSPRCLCRRCVPSALADPAGREATAHAAHAR